MLCSRCKMALQAEIEKMGLQRVSVDLGEIELNDEPTQLQLQQLMASLKALNFEIIADKKVRTIEKIKVAIVTLVHHSNHDIKTNLSAYIASQIHQDYN